jgi:hypothetical protein
LSAKSTTAAPRTTAPAGAAARWNGWLLFLLLTTACSVYLIQYGAEPSLPGASTAHPEGWWGWWDQGRYIRSAAALARLDFQPELHWYFLGYPAMGAPFYRILPDHPFLIPNLAWFAVILWMLAAIFTRFVSPLESVLVVSAGLLLQPALFQSLRIPWNSIPCHALLYVGAYVLLFRRRSGADYVIAGAAAGVSFLCRSVAPLFFLPLLAARILGEKEMQERLRGAGLFALAFLPFPALLAGAHWAIFGGLVSPYMRNEARVGFSISNLAYKLYLMLVDVRPVYPAEARTLLNQFPWLLVVGPGVLAALQRERAAVAALLGSMALAFGFYSTYNNFTAAKIFEYLMVHYIVWIFPLLALFAYLTLRTAWTSLPKPAFAAAILLPAACFSLFRLELAPVDAAAGLAGVSFTLKEPRRFQVLDLEGWPADGSAFPYVILDGRELRPWTHFQPVRRAAWDRVFFNRLVGAGRIELSADPGFKGQLTVSGLKLYRPQWRFAPGLSFAKDCFGRYF